ncbi:hypothetical protein YC2023_098404 [Brassica napus]
MGKLTSLGVNQSIFKANVYAEKKENRMMMTGLHTVADIYFVKCGSYVGWRYEFAFEKNQQYKEGKSILEREFEAKPKPEAEEERQIQRTGLWYGLDRWEETRLRWERTSSVFGKRKIEKDLRNLDKSTVRDDPAIIQLKTIVEALRRTLKERLWPE